MVGEAEKLFNDPFYMEKEDQDQEEMIEINGLAELSNENMSTSNGVNESVRAYLNRSENLELNRM